MVRLGKPALPPQDAAAGQMLVVAAAVGVSSCFGAPVSGERCSVFIPTFDLVSVAPPWFHVVSPLLSFPHTSCIYLF